MFTTIINDCRDDNARARQESRLASLLPTAVSFVGVQSDLEAGMQLLDILDATEGRAGLVLVNVAPRGGHTTKWENGTPFGYFRYGDTVVVSTLDGFALSGVKKFGLTDTITVLDTHSAATAMANASFITDEVATHIPATQFRSFDFTPRVGAFLLQGHDVPGTPQSIEAVPDTPAAIWHIDNFGNCKTTLTPDDIDTTTATETHFGTFPYQTKLRDLADGASALVRGSSGLGDTRLLELMTQRANFAGQYEAKIGDALFIDQSYASRATN